MRAVLLFVCCSLLAVSARADEAPPAEPTPVEAPAPTAIEPPAPAQTAAPAAPAAAVPIEERIEAAQPAIAAAAPPCACKAEPPVREHVIEVTFGSSQLFIHQSILNKSGNVAREIIPVTSALLMIEWLFWRRFSLLSLFNLPLVTEKTVVDGQAREKFVAPSLATGLRFSAIRLDVFAHSKLEFQVAALVGVTLGGTDAAPVSPWQQVAFISRIRPVLPCISALRSRFRRTRWACSTASVTGSEAASRGTDRAARARQESTASCDTRRDL